VPLALAPARSVARSPRPLGRPAAAPPTSAAPTAELAAAAQAAGADVRSGPDFMEISFPPPAGATPATVARTTAGTAPASLAPSQGPRSLGGGAVLARAAHDASFSASGSSNTDGVVEAVLRAMREENEHLGILDGIDPLF
jgi:hypothetical protein